MLIYRKALYCHYQMVCVVEMEEKMVARLVINERIWRQVKASAVERGESVQEFAANLLWVGLRIIDEKEGVLEEALWAAEKKFLDSGFQVLRGGAILFERYRELQMELMKENIHIDITYSGISFDRNLDFRIGHLQWGEEDLYEYLFSWDDVPGNDSEKLLEFFTAADIAHWTGNAEIFKSDDGKTIRIVEDENSVEIIIDELAEKATIKNADEMTPRLKVKKESDKLNIYGSNVYYENEKEEKIVLEALQIVKETFSAVLKDYAKLNLHRKEIGRML